MSASRPRRLLYAVLGLLFLLRLDLWQWKDGHLVLGLPVGLTYHVVFCLVTALLMALLVRHAWPSQLSQGSEDP